MQFSSYRDLARNKFSELEKWLYSGSRAKNSIDMVERGIESNGRELLRLLLQAHIENLGKGDKGDAIMCTIDNATICFRRKRIDSRSLITLFGRITISRVGYYYSGCRAIHPLDEQLQLPSRAYSYEVQRRVVKMATQGPFDEAVGNVSETMGLEIPKRSAEELLVDAARDFDAYYAQKGFTHHCHRDPILVASVDCKGIPMVKSELAKMPVRLGKGQKLQKKKMATVASVYTQQPYFRTAQDVINNLFRIVERNHESRSRDRSRCHDKRVWASLTSSKDCFIDDVVKEVHRRNQENNKTVVVVTDGERALQLRIGRSMKNIIMILDLAHVLEYLWKTAHVFHEEGSDEAVEFVKNRVHRILTGNVGQVVKGLRQMVTKRCITGKKAEVIQSTTKYLYKNRSRMRYDRYLKKGLPIASGSVEGACKNLIKDRMERAGMRWTIRMAEAMVKVRALYVSNDLDEYWKYHIAQEQIRLYRNRPWKKLNAK